MKTFLLVLFIFVGPFASAEVGVTFTCNVSIDNSEFKVENKQVIAPKFLNGEVTILPTGDRITVYYSQDNVLLLSLDKKSEETGAYYTHIQAERDGLGKLSLRFKLNLGNDFVKVDCTPSLLNDK